MNYGSHQLLISRRAAWRPVRRIGATMFVEVAPRREVLQKIVREPILEPMPLETQRANKTRMTKPLPQWLVTSISQISGIVRE